MTTELESFVQGKWVKGTGKAVTLVNPANGEAVATSSTAGIDFARTLAFARDVGGPALRKSSFAERGAMLRAMSRAIHAHRDELIQLAIVNAGNTRSDAKFDIDGASGTLAAYADLATTLGDGPLLTDGDGVQLGRSPRLFGAHILVPREGVAIHINAFNFPAWGFAEKAAVALLAGMPVITKPATSTALTAWRIFKLLDAEKILPEGALSFIAGSSGDLLDHVGGQDVLAFTGSGATGTMLRGGKSALANSVRVNVEADSLNAAVLGPDVDDTSDLMNLFIGDVVRDMTQKAGQKCTAIRRVYVPREKVDVVLERIAERLAAVKTGDPAREETTMGPLATEQQLKDVRDGIAKLATTARFAFGSADRLGDQGFFVGPVLLHADKPDTKDAIHSHEVFGPVSTVMPYDGTANEAVRLVAGGGGGLVSSVYSDDKEYVRAAVLGIAPFHGRVTIGSSKIASQAIPPGTVMPQLVHGGPGRAGSGEELGGRRGLSFYMQRVALQGDRALLDAITGASSKRD